MLAVRVLLRLSAHVRMTNRGGRSFKHQESSHLRTCWWDPRLVRSLLVSHQQETTCAHSHVVSLSAVGDNIKMFFLFCYSSEAGCKNSDTYVSIVCLHLQATLPQDMCIYVLLGVESSSCRGSLFILMAVTPPACGKPMSRVSFNKYICMIQSERRYPAVRTVNKGLTQFLHYDWFESSSIVSWATSPVSLVYFKLPRLSGTVLNQVGNRIYAKCSYLTVLIFFSSTCFCQLPERKALGVIIFTLSIAEKHLHKVSTVGFCRHSADTSGVKRIAGHCEFKWCYVNKHSKTWH